MTLPPQAWLAAALALAALVPLAIVAGGALPEPPARLGVPPARVEAPLVRADAAFDPLHAEALAGPRANPFAARERGRAVQDPTPLPPPPPLLLPEPPPTPYPPP